MPDFVFGEPPRPEMYQQGWIDLNKNGTKDVYEDPSQPVEKRIDNLLKQMTLEEKAGQLNQLHSGGGKAKFPVFFESARKGEVSSFIWAYQVAYHNEVQRAAVEGARLGIPIIFGMDLIHGTRTTFPISLGLACSFEPELFEKAQTVSAREARAEGNEWVFAPMCDLARDPRWGRVAETCGEDPYLSALCNAAQVRGFQGKDPSAPDRVAACLKHYVGYSAVTAGRDYNDSEITEWTLRNAHLPSFHAGIKAGALTVMSSFNAIGGIPSVANRHTLTEILRDEWKFNGFVVSDWQAVTETINWGYAKDPADAAKLAISAGNDMDMLKQAYLENLPGEIKAGRFSEDILNQAVRRVLRVKFQVGLFDRPYTDENLSKSATHPEDMELARECVVKSTVLLKNTGVVPLSKEYKKVALIGPFAEDVGEMIGCWGGFADGKKVVTLAQGLKDKLPAGTDLKVVKGCSVNTIPATKTLQDGKVVPDESAPPVDKDVKIVEAVAAARNADVVIMALGEPKGWTGEAASRAFLTLTGHQQELFDAIAATGKPLVTVVFSGRPLVLPQVWEKASAVFYAWQPGAGAGSGLADLLVGNESPSGRLSMSVLRDVAQVPFYYNYYNTGRPGTAGEYRDMKSKEPQFWFGYGLTYSAFSYSPVKITPSANGKPAEASVTVTNTGKREAIETPQLYIRQLVCHEGARPKQELRGFKRVRLQPGEKADVSFPLTGEVLGYIDRNGNPRVDVGDYEIWIAPRAQQGTPVKFTLSL
ncbi:MAG: glycoside hydrolase family 3 N-terminal domain-containing protein [Verrucomicrobiae bacterium]